jgi:two-component system sensor histidine kinase GlrK
VTFDPKLRTAIVVGEPSKLRAIVDNLLSNAIKYSPPSGAIAIELAVRDGFAVLDVIDQGPGVDPADRSRIFDSFYQGKTPPGGRIKGSGLGLAIAQEYALAHGGRVELVDRAPGSRGAHFRLWLPIAVGEAVPGGRQSAASKPAVTIAGQG